MKSLLKQGLKFVGFSGIGWILDFCIYTVLGIWSQSLQINNTISSWVGVTFVFVFSTRHVFKNNSRISLKWKYGIYLLYQCVLIFVISKLLSIINGFILNYVELEIVRSCSSIIAKILITPVTMTLNFFVTKIIIEKI